MNGIDDLGEFRHGIYTLSTRQGRYTRFKREKDDHVNLKSATFRQLTQPCTKTCTYRDSPYKRRAQSSNHDPPPLLSDRHPSRFPQAGSARPFRYNLPDPRSQVRFDFITHIRTPRCTLHASLEDIDGKSGHPRYDPRQSARRHQFPGFQLTPLRLCFIDE